MYLDGEAWKKWVNIEVRCWSLLDINPLYVQDFLTFLQVLQLFFEDA